MTALSLGPRGGKLEEEWSLGLESFEIVVEKGGWWSAIGWVQVYPAVNVLEAQTLLC